MRLIDADALIEQMEEDMEQMEEPLAKMFTGAAISDIKHAPTVEAPDINVGNMDVISKWKADFKGYINDLNMPKDDYDGIMEYIDEVPSAQTERPKGKWIHQAKFSRVECDQCGKVFRNSFAPKNFCPNCGADMRGEQND